MSLTQLLGIVVATMIIAMVVDLSDRVVKTIVIRDEVDRLIEEVRAAEDENAQLQKRLDYAKSDEYVEEEVRRIKWARPGETVVVVVPGSPRSVPQPEPAVPAQKLPPARPYWQQWWRLFFDPLESPSR